MSRRYSSQIGSNRRFPITAQKRSYLQRGVRQFRQAARAAPSAGRRRLQAVAAANARTAGFLGIETKFYDTSLANTTVAAATDASGGEYDPSATSMISTPATGDGPQNRDGKRIVLKNVQLKGIIHRPAAEDAVNPPVHDKVFVALVLDTQSNAAQMNSEDCYQNTAASAILNACPVRNLVGGNRFRILKSEVFNMDALTCGVEGNDLHSSAAVSKDFEWFIPFKDPLIINFNTGTTSSIANVVDNSLHVIAYSVAALSTISYNARVRFQG